jgi:hypothetical protein
MSIIPSTTVASPLPEDIYLQCFSYLDAKDLAAVFCRVSKLFKNLSEQGILWESLTRLRFGDKQNYKSSQGTQSTQCTNWKITYQRLIEATKRPFYFPCRNYIYTLKYYPPRETAKDQIILLQQKSSHYSGNPCPGFVGKSSF